MRYSFDIPSSDDPKTLTPTDPQLQWVPLQNHPLFSTTTATTSTAVPENLLAWDGASRVYYWDSAKHCLNRISIRLGEPDPTSVLAASPAKVPPITFSTTTLLKLKILFCSKHVICTK